MNEENEQSPAQETSSANEMARSRFLDAMGLGAESGGNADSGLSKRIDPTSNLEEGVVLTPAENDWGSAADEEPESAPGMNITYSIEGADEAFDDAELPHPECEMPDAVSDVKPEATVETMSEDGILNLSCPSCDGDLVLRHEHLGVEGQCVWCEVPIVAAQSGMDSEVRIFVIGEKPSRVAEPAEVIVPETIANEPKAETVEPQEEVESFESVNFSGFSTVKESGSQSDAAEPAPAEASNSETEKSFGEGFADMVTKEDLREAPVEVSEQKEAPAGFAEPTQAEEASETESATTPEPWGMPPTAPTPEASEKEEATAELFAQPKEITDEPEKVEVSQAEAEPLEAAKDFVTPEPWGAPANEETTSASEEEAKPEATEGSPASEAWSTSPTPAAAKDELPEAAVKEDAPTGFSTPEPWGAPTAPQTPEVESPKVADKEDAPAGFSMPEPWGAPTAPEPTDETPEQPKAKAEEASGFSVPESWGAAAPSEAVAEKVDESTSFEFVADKSEDKLESFAQPEFVAAPAETESAPSMSFGFPAPAAEEPSSPVDIDDSSDNTLESLGWGSAPTVDEPAEAKPATPEAASGFQVSSDAASEPAAEAGVGETFGFSLPESANESKPAESSEPFSSFAIADTPSPKPEPSETQSEASQVEEKVDLPESTFKTAPTMNLFGEAPAPSAVASEPAPSPFGESPDVTGPAAAEEVGDTEESNESFAGFGLDGASDPEVSFAPAPPALPKEEVTQKQDVEPIVIGKESKRAKKKGKSGIAVLLVIILGLVCGAALASFVLPVEQYVEQARTFLEAKFVTVESTTVAP